MRLVLDTDVLVAAIRSNTGASQRLLRSALRRRFTLLLSVPMVIEYEAVMTRTEQLAASGLSAADVGRLLDALVTVAEPVQIAFLWRPQLTDPNDEMVLETAVNGQADRIVTFNRRHFAEAGQSFGFVVVDPGEAVATLEDRP
jgi:putative PIN family toxin of toxin-antitoxin system